MDNLQPKAKGTHAIVVGGGFGGLLAGKVLAKYYDKVTIIERDSEPSPNSLELRPGVPQGTHAHYLLPRGLEAIQKILPRFFDTVIKRGAHVTNLYQDMLFSDLKNFKKRVKTSKTGLTLSRSLIESTERSLVSEDAKITFKYNHNVNGLLANFKENKITGVRLQDLTKNEDVNLYGDIIVDTSGIKTSFPEWLEALGYDKPDVTNIPMNYIQISRRYRFPKEFKPDWNYSVRRELNLRKTAYIVRLEEDNEGAQWLFAFVSLIGAPITATDEGYLEFAKMTLDPELYNQLKNAKPITPIKQISVPNIRRFWYANVKRLPTSFFAMGDAICIWPPHTGLGMTTAAESAVNLDEFFAQNTVNKAVNMNRDFFKIVDKSMARGWSIHIEKDVMSQVYPKNTLLFKFIAWYKSALNDLANTNARACKAMLGVAFSEKPLYTLFHPAIVFNIIWSKIKGK